MAIKEFDKGFTGVLLMMEPGTQFARANKISQLSLTTYAKNYIHQAPSAVFQVLGASLLLQLLGLIFPLLTMITINNLIPTKGSSALQILGIGMIMLVLSQMITKQLR